MQARNKGSLTESVDKYSSLRSNKESFTSITTSQSGDISSNKCLVCHKGFMLRRKFTCQLCLNVFCSDHCTRKRKLNPNDEMTSICDTCDQEETKKEIDLEIEGEIKKLSEELNELRETNEKLFKEQYNNSASLNNIEMEIKKQEWNARKEEEELQSVLEAEQNKGQKIRKQMDLMRKILDESNTSERFMGEQCVESEFEAETLKLEMKSVQEHNEETLLQIDKINSNLRQSLALDQIRKILCENCLYLLNSNIEKTNTESTDVVETVRQFHRNSIIAEETDKPVKECIIS